MCCVYGTQEQDYTAHIFGKPFQAGRAGKAPAICNLQGNARIFSVLVLIFWNGHSGTDPQGEVRCYNRSIRGDEIDDNKSFPISMIKLLYYGYECYAISMVLKA